LDPEEAGVSWTWRYEKGNGTVIEVAEPLDEDFPTQADAESWLGETWRQLLEAGVDQVTLMERDRVVYGPMSLHPAE
jgi:hypothetical protein